MKSIFQNANRFLPGIRYVIDIVNNTISNAITECNCNTGRKIERFYSYYDFPKQKLNLNFNNSNYYFSKNRNECLKLMSRIISDINKNNSTKGIYLHGEPGIGKSFTFILLANKLAALKKNILFISVPTLIYQLQNVNDNTNVNYINKKNFYRLCLNAEILFLDDIGSGFMTQWIRDGILFHILNHRMNHSMLTFFTSNYSIYELGNWFLNNKPGKLNTNNYVTEAQIIKLLRRIQMLSHEVKWNK